MGPVIICAIDEATAEGVVLTAAELAPALGARVMLLHVERDPALFSASSDRELEPHRATRHRNEFLRAIGALLPYGTPVDERVALGAPAGEIVAVAEDVGASLIIVGSRRRGARLRAHSGGVLQNVIRRASCPVVIAPIAVRHHRRRSTSPSNIDRSVLVGVGSTEQTLAVVELGRQLAAIFDDRLVLVHAQDHSSQNALPNVVRQAHESAGPDAGLVLAGGPAGYVLDRACDHEHARLIVIGSGDMQQAAAADESLAVQLSGIALCPIVVLPGDAPPTGLQPADADPFAIAAGRSR